MWSISNTSGSLFQSAIPQRLHLYSTLISNNARLSLLASTLWSLGDPITKRSVGVSLFFDFFPLLCADPTIWLTSIFHRRHISLILVIVPPTGFRFIFLQASVKLEQFFITCSSSLCSYLWYFLFIICFLIWNSYLWQKTPWIPFGIPNGSRTRIPALRTQFPKPLEDGYIKSAHVFYVHYYNMGCTLFECAVQLAPHRLNFGTPYGNRTHLFSLKGWGSHQKSNGCIYVWQSRRDSNSHNALMSSVLETDVLPIKLRDC